MSSKVKWFFVILFIVCFITLSILTKSSAKGLFFALGVVIFFSLLGHAFKKKPVQTILACVVILGLFILGVRLAQSIKDVHAQSSEPRSSIQFLIDGQNINISGQSEASEPIVAEESSSTDCEYQDRYPAKVVQWCGLIEAESKEHGMDPLLIASVMLQESGGQPEVMSGSGAVGLMQVMPRDGISATFQCINGPCFANRPSIEELKNPSFNVDYGVRMLAGLIEKRGDIREALKSYGPYDVGYQYADKVLAIRNGL